MKQRNLVGQKFGRLRVCSLTTPDPKTRNRRWMCVCECGENRPVWESALLRNHTKSCGCLHRFSKGVFAQNKVLYSYRVEAENRGLEWGLSNEQALGIMEQTCSYCDAVPSNLSKTTNGDFQYNGIDRVDNSLGYDEGNCVACCRVCNFMKGTMSREEFLSHIRRIYGKTT